MEYDLKKLQQKEIEILKHIDAACERLNIKYFIFYGTLLGAVRHGGFIPWDDDMDICMLRDDYEKFLREGAKYLPENLFIQHYTTEPETNNLFIKVRDKNTLFLEKASAELDICHGIFVDVFPIDKISADGGIRRREFEKRQSFGKLICLYSLGEISDIKNPRRRIACRLAHYTVCRLIPKYRLMEREDKRRKKLNAEGGEFYLRDSQYDRGCGKLTEIEGRRKYPFDGEEFYGPENSGEVLGALYGDYMKLPPPEKRRTHKPLRIEFQKEREV